VSVASAALFASCAPKSRPKALDSFTDVVSRVGILYVATFFVGIVFFISSLPAMAVERAAFYREKAARVYDTGPYSLSFLLAEAPFLVAYSVAHVLHRDHRRVPRGGSLLLPRTSSTSASTSPR